LKNTESLIADILGTKKGKAIFNVFRCNFPPFSILKAGIVMKNDTFSYFKGIDSFGWVDIVAFSNTID